MLYPLSYGGGVETVYSQQNEVKRSAVKRRPLHPTRLSNIVKNVRAFVGLGSNLPPRRGHLCDAVSAMEGRDGITVVGCSCVYETEAHTLDGEEGADYLNAAAEIRTRLPAEALLEVLLDIERQFGRERPYRWAPRTIDLDLLLYGQATIASPDLVVPHPRMDARRFVLAPLAEMAGDVTVPRTGGRTVRMLLEACADHARCVVYSERLC